MRIEYTCIAKGCDRSFRFDLSPTPSDLYVVQTEVEKMMENLGWSFSRLMGHCPDHTYLAWPPAGDRFAPKTPVVQAEKPKLAYVREIEKTIQSGSRFRLESLAGFSMHEEFMVKLVPGMVLMSRDSWYEHPQVSDSFESAIRRFVRGYCNDGEVGVVIGRL